MQLMEKRLVSKWIHDAISKLDLDLHDMVVLTEGATGVFAVSPVLASAAAATRVYALTDPGRVVVGKRHSVMEVRSAIKGYADAVDPSLMDFISVTGRRSCVKHANIVLNLGYVRPIDAQMISKMRTASVISLMYEPWEFRLEDIDIRAAALRGIPVMGVDETNVLPYCGELAVKLMHDRGIPAKRAWVLVLGDNRIADAIAYYLRPLCANVRNCCYTHGIAEYDAVIVADPFREYSATEFDEDPIIITGKVGDVGELRHMHHNLSELGPRPVIELQAMGMKVGRAMWDARCDGLHYAEFYRRVRAHSPAEALHCV